MAPTKKCSHCGTVVPLDTLHCPNCPASFDSEEGAAFSRRRRRTHIPQPLLWGLVAAMVAVGMWRFITFVLTYADTEAKTNPIDQMSQSLSGTTQSASDAAMALVSSSATASSAAGSSSQLSTEPPPDADPEAALPPDESEAIMISHDSDSAPRSSDRRRAKRKGGDDGEWRLRGTVYDLVTLRPVAGVQVSLKDSETARKIDTVTDARGRYRFAVPPLSGRGYSVVFTSDKYAPSYVDPDDEKVRQRSAADREKLASQLARELDPPYPVQGLAGEPVTTDFYLAPRE